MSLQSKVFQADVAAFNDGDGWRDILTGKPLVIEDHYLTHDYPHPRDRTPASHRKPLHYKPSLVSHRVLNKSRPVEHFKP